MQPSGPSWVGPFGSHPSSQQNSYGHDALARLLVESWVQECSLLVFRVGFAEQGGERSVQLIVPPALKADYRQQLQSGARSILPIGVLGHCETDLAHKANVMLLTAKLLTGTPEVLKQWRISVQ